MKARSSCTTIAEQSCTSGRNAFFTGMYPLRTGMIPPQLPGSPSYLRPGTPALAKFLLDLGYNTGEFGKNHLGDHTDALPTAHGFQEYWGYLYHLDAMQRVSFPDINKTPDRSRRLRRRARTRRSRACRRSPARSIRRRPVLPDAAAPGRLRASPPTAPRKNQTCKRPGPADARALEDGRRGNLGQGHRLPRPQRSEEDQQAVLRLVQPGAHARHDRAVDKYVAMIGEPGGKDWGVNEAGMKQMDDNIGVVLKKLEDMGQLDNTIVVFTTDNGAETITFPDGGTTPFKGGKLSTWEGGMRAPMLVRWPGVIKPGTVKNEIFASLDWLPTLVNIAGGAKGDELKKQIEAGQYPGIVKTTLDGVDQTDYLAGRSEKSARDYLLLLFRRGPVGGALQELEDLLHDGVRQPGGLYLPARFLITGPRSSTSSAIRSRHRSVRNHKTLMGHGRRHRLRHRPPTSTTGTCCPSARQLWLKELETYAAVPAAAGPGELQPRPGDAADQAGQGLPVAATKPARVPNWRASLMRRPPISSCRPRAGRITPRSSS